MQYFPVWISDVNNFNDALHMIRSVGEIAGKPIEAERIIQTISTSFEALKPAINQLSLAYFIWRKPYMIAGKGTYIDDMISRCGLHNVINENRYPEIDTQRLAELNPDVVMLSSEPYPFKQKHIYEFKAILPRAKIILVDGEMFSWYGSRLQYSAGYFAEIIKMLENETRSNYL
jgi:ABC-type Fe3+-hydroxamate transport system substrate-binding protein